MKKVKVKSKTLRMKTGVKAGFCRYLWYGGDVEGFVDCMEKYKRW